MDPICSTHCLYKHKLFISWITENRYIKRNVDVCMSFLSLTCCYILDLLRMARMSQSCNIVCRLNIGFSYHTGIFFFKELSVFYKVD